MEHTEFKPIGYVYSITNLLTNKTYVGLHESLEFDPTYWGSGKLIQQAYEKYGKENFVRSVLDWATTREELREKEKLWIQKLDTYENGYNLTLGGDGGVTWENPEDNPAKRPEVREKIRQQKLALGDSHPMKDPARRAAVSAKNTGRLVGDANPMKRPEVKAKHLENCRSDQHRQNLSQSGKALGDNHPSKRDSFKQRMSEVMTQRMQEEPGLKEKASQRCKQLVGGKNPAAKKVRIIETGQEFECLKDLQNFLQIGGWVISDRLHQHLGKPIKTPEHGIVTIEVIK